MRTFIAEKLIKIKNLIEDKNYKTAEKEINVVSQICETMYGDCGYSIIYKEIHEQGIILDFYRNKLTRKDRTDLLNKILPSLLLIIKERKQQDQSLYNLPFESKLLTLNKNLITELGD